MLNEGQGNLVNTFQDLWERPERDVAFLSNKITANTMWVYAYNPTTKQKSSRWNSSFPRPEEARQDQFNQMWKVCSLFLFPYSRSCALRSCSTRTNYRPTITYWHPTAAGKCEAKTTCSPCFVGACLSGDNNMTPVPHPPYSPHFSQTPDGLKREGYLIPPRFKQNGGTHLTSFQQRTLRIFQTVEWSLCSLLSPMEIAMKGTILIGR